MTDALGCVYSDNYLCKRYLPGSANLQAHRCMKSCKKNTDRHLLCWTAADQRPGLFAQSDVSYGQRVHGRQLTTREACIS